jgi:hypothetical protein
MFHVPYNFASTFPSIWCRSWNVNMMGTYSALSFASANIGISPALTPTTVSDTWTTGTAPLGSTTFTIDKYYTFQQHSNSWLCLKPMVPSPRTVSYYDPGDVGNTRYFRLDVYTCDGNYNIPIVGIWNVNGTSAPNPMFSFIPANQTLTVNVASASFHTIIGSYPLALQLDYYGLYTMYSYIKVNFVKINSAMVPSSPNHTLT